jgi:hypothetical protein
MPEVLSKCAMSVGHRMGKRFDLARLSKRFREKLDMCRTAGDKHCSHCEVYRARTCNEAAEVGPANEPLKTSQRQWSGNVLEPHTLAIGPQPLGARTAEA